jgi:hypothetical protein
MLLTLILCVPFAAASVPLGWVKAGSEPGSYEVELDPQVTYLSKPSARIRSNADSVEGFGTLMQMVRAEKYKAQRVRLLAAVKVENVKQWAGLWMGVDGKNNDKLAFDNMQDRPIQGVRDWREYEVVLDVPEAAQNLAFGVLLAGTGTVWISDVKIDIVSNNVATTGTKHDRPTNLDFSR